MKPIAQAPEVVQTQKLNFQKWLEAATNAFLDLYWYYVEKLTRNLKVTLKIFSIFDLAKVLPFLWEFCLLLPCTFCLCNISEDRNSRIIFNHGKNSSSIKNKLLLKHKVTWIYGGIAAGWRYYFCEVSAKAHLCAAVCWCLNSQPYYQRLAGKVIKQTNKTIC